jgi:hypothetical protein
VYTPEEREGLRDDLIAKARVDARITGAALTGSASIDRQDRWSDIDLAFGIKNAAEVPTALAEWTARMYDEHRAVHHVDVRFEAWIYRVFLLSSSLQVDLAFAPQGEFAARGPTFKLLFGSAVERSHRQPPDARDLIGLAWLYALHVRPALARQKLWQAEYMLSAARDHVLAAACRRLDLPTSDARGIDLLPAAFLQSFQEALIPRFEFGAIVAAFGAVIRALIAEARHADSRLATRLEPALLELLTSTQAAEPPGRRD